MRQFLTATALTVFCAVAHCGPLMDKFSIDIKAYLEAQSGNPNRVIKDTDEQGALARAVLNPQRMTALMAEAAFKMAQAMPTLLVKVLEKQLEEGKFSPSFTPMVNARIQKLRADAATL